MFRESPDFNASAAVMSRKVSEMERPRKSLDDLSNEPNGESMWMNFTDSFFSFAGDSRFRLSGGGHIKKINRLIGGEH